MHRTDTDPRAMAGRRVARAGIWAIAVAVVAGVAAHDAFGLGGEGSHGLFNDWLHDGALWLAAGLCLAGALRTGAPLEPRSPRRSRAAWSLVALALASWALGETLWSIRFSASDGPSGPTVSDVFWLAWYPLMATALALLVRERVRTFTLHRWIDGVVVMLLLAAPWVALFLQPVAEESHAGLLAKALAFAYPLGDFVLVGGVLGVCALMGWQPGRMWSLLGVGLAVTGVADAVSSVTTLAGSQAPGVYGAAWLAGAFLVAYAPWQRHPGPLEPAEVSGWRAIALPLAAQILAIAVQIYAYFWELPASERLLTAAVLIIAVVQIILTRPGRHKSPANRARCDPASDELGSVSPATSPEN
jgi:hypothetical protein